jgi:hypothetical protein
VSAKTRNMETARSMECTPEEGWAADVIRHIAKDLVIFR